MKTIDFFRKFSLLLLLLITFLSINSCGGKKDDSKPEDIETMNSGKLTVYCENGVWGLIDTCFDMYSADYKNVKLTKEKVTARKAMAQLLGGTGRIVIVSRDYLKDEDSLMNAFKVEKHVKMPIANDALVFFTKSDYPLDTLNTDELKEIFTKKESTLLKFHPAIKNEPEYAINDQMSSEYSNFVKLVLKSENPVKPLKLFSEPDSVVYYVINNTNSIGIGYLSQIFKHPELKALRIGYRDTTNQYIPATIPVHQGWLIQGKYPFIITIYAYLLEDRRNLPWWFGTFLSKEAKVQKYIKDMGIVPSYAKVILKPEE